MCLVLGCPGAGCTTFLRTIANQREGYSNVSGEVTYAGITAEEMQKYYKGEVVYNQEGEPIDNTHHPASNSSLR
jgi:ABC-type multidrug transport system ATPase subunit